MSARTARSRLTRDEAVSDPRSVSRSVSGAMPTVKLGGEAVKVTTVRHTPLMAMLSPSWQSERSVEVGGSVMVSEVPPVASEGLSSETTVRRVSEGVDELSAVERLGDG